jgi:hypothetical protein
MKMLSDINHLDMTEEELALRESAIVNLHIDKIKKANS